MEAPFLRLVWQNKGVVSPTPTLCTGWLCKIRLAELAFGVFWVNAIDVVHRYEPRAKRKLRDYLDWCRQWTACRIQVPLYANTHPVALQLKENRKILESIGYGLSRFFRFPRIRMVNQRGLRRRTITFFRVRKAVVIASACMEERNRKKLKIPDYEKRALRQCFGNLKW